MLGEGESYRSSAQYLLAETDYNVSLTKEVLELIKEPLDKKAKTADSCVETSDEP